MANPIINITKKPDKVTVSKESFDRAFRCKEFLEGVPDSVLALKGLNDVVTLMLLVLQNMNIVVAPGKETPEEREARKIQAMEMLFDELAEQCALEKGETRGYARRTSLINELRAVVKKVKDQPVLKLYIGEESLMPQRWCRNINRMLPDYCSRCDGEGKLLIDIVSDSPNINGVRKYLTCTECRGYGHTLFVVEIEDEETGESTSHTAMPYEQLDFHPGLTESKDRPNITPDPNPYRE